MKPQRRRSAFTLIELLLAITLTAMVMGGALVSLSVILQAYKNSSSQTDSTDIARMIFERMRLDLSATFISPHKAQTRFVGMDQQNEAFPTDSLTFISTINNPVNSGGGTSDLAEVQYFIDLDDSTPERWLVRRFDNTPDTDPFSGGELALLGPQVCSLDFQYYDGNALWPAWDSAQEIPMAVFVEIGIFEPLAPGEAPGPENVRKFSNIIWIATYREPPSDSLGPMGGTEALERSSANSPEGQK